MERCRNHPNGGRSGGDEPVSEVKFDEIGYWSEVKLAIIKDYARAYSTILAKQSNLKHIYIDGFAGAGVHVSRSTGQFVPGSPLNALLVEPPFTQYHLIDLNTGKAGSLRKLASDRLNRDVFVYDGDCNNILLKQVLPLARYEDYRRALCILDPYGLHLDWEVIAAAGASRAIDLFLNFPIMDMNRNALWKDASQVDSDSAARLTRYWGDESWKQAAYRQEENLFGFDDMKTSNQDVADAFRDRLKKVAGFKNVIEPMPMRNSQGATVYYLYFASPNATANKIATDVFDKYKDRTQ